MCKWYNLQVHYQTSSQNAVYTQWCRIQNWNHHFCRQRNLSWTCNNNHLHTSAFMTDVVDCCYGSLWTSARYQGVQCLEPAYSSLKTTVTIWLHRSCFETMCNICVAQCLEPAYSSLKTTVTIWLHRSCFETMCNVCVVQCLEPAYSSLNTTVTIWLFDCIDHALRHNAINS